MKAVITALVVFEVPDVWSVAEGHEILEGIAQIRPTLRTRGGALNRANPRLVAVLASNDLTIDIVGDDVAVESVLGWEIPADAEEVTRSTP